MDNLLQVHLAPQRTAGTAVCDIEELRAARFSDLPAHCMSASEPGVDEVDEWRDWTALETTPDQMRIEAYLRFSRLSGRSVLHVGVGNSSLAARLSHRTRRIVGTTISSNEVAYAASLNLPNYRVELHNKYSGKPLTAGDTFDYIVDNNPTTFCCCLHHMMVMMDFYVRVLAPDGQILTDRDGLGWVVSTAGANPRWRFSFDDLAFVAGKVGLQTFAIDESLISLARQRPRPARLYHALRVPRHLVHKMRYGLVSPGTAKP